MADPIAPTSVTPMPTPAPVRTMDQTTFDQAVANRIAAEPTYTAQFNAALANVYNNAVSAYEDAAAALASQIAAAGSATAAAGSATTAASVSGASAWNVATNYTQYAVAIGNDGQTYRATVAVTGGADPAADTTGKWARITGQQMGQRAITGASTVTRADLGFVLELSGTFTLAFAATAALGQGFWCVLKNGSGEATLDPNGAETIDGVASYPMLPNEVRFLYKDRTTGALKTIIWTVWRRATTSSGAGFTHTWTPGYIAADVDAVGGSGGAGSGAKGGTSVNGVWASGGSPGGAPARVVRRLPALSVGTTETILIGAAGTSGAAVTTTNTAGNPGTDGGNTTWGSRLTVYGGVGGIGGQISSGVVPQYAGVSGSGAFGKGAVSTWGSTNSAFLTGGAPFFGVNNGPSDSATELGGGGMYVNGTGGNTMYGGAGIGSGSTNSSPATAGGSSYQGVAAGGWGGHITTTFVVLQPSRAGGNGGWNLTTGAAPGTSGTAPTAGTNGAASTDGDSVGGSGGGGGSTLTTGVNAGKGGDGGWPGGAPGGGGAASEVAGNSGAGGAAAPGRVIASGVKA